MAITTRQQRQQRRNEALQLIADGVPPTDAATQLTVKWGCSRRTSLRDIEVAQGELANALRNQRKPNSERGVMACRRQPQHLLMLVGKGGTMTRKGVTASEKKQRHECAIRQIDAVMKLCN